MTRLIHNVTLAPDIVLGGEQPVLFAGPCVIESNDLVYQVATYLRDLTQRLGIPFVFKASYDKANRLSHASYRSIGFETALKILERVRQELHIPVLTDVHETIQVATVAT